MKLFVYSYRQQDEERDFDAFSRETGIVYTATHLPPTADTAALAEGCDAVAVFLTPCGAGGAGALGRAGGGLRLRPHHRL